MKFATHAIAGQPMTAEELRKINAYWRAANYLSVGQIYLYANPLLRKPLKLEHVKPRLLGHWGTTPGLNFVYADVDGNIAWVAAGLAPIRKNWNGLLPVPGQNGEYEWNGFLKLDDLPQLTNPASGFIATANHNILPPDYKHALGYEFGAPWRFARIVERLLASDTVRPLPGGGGFTVPHAGLYPWQWQFPQWSGLWQARTSSLPMEMRSQALQCP